LFFLDPPYSKAPYYTYSFKISDFEELVEPLAGVRSDFVISTNDHPEMRKMFAGFTIKPVKFSYCAGRSEGGKFRNC
jgi:DNA adenine methylase